MQSLLGYPIKITPHQTVKLPRGAKPLSVSFVGGNHMLYVLGDMNGQYEDVGISMFAMGETCPLPETSFIGAVQKDDRDHHVFYTPGPQATPH